MTDKQDYKAALKTLDVTSSFAAILNRLGGVEIDTEDIQLKTMLRGIAQEIRRLNPGPTTKKVRLLDIPLGHPSAGTLAKMVLATSGYCQKCVNSADEQWKILANLAGWRPPQ